MNTTTMEPRPSAPSGRTELRVTGMTCNNCARTVTGIIQDFPGVAGVNVALDEQRATVRWAAAVPADLAPLLGALEDAGYGSQVIQAGAAQSAPKLGGWAVNLLLGVPVTGLLMLGEWVFGWGETRWFAWFAFALAGTVQIFAGAKFYRGAWAQLKAGSSNMDTLVALGSTTAFGYSAWALLAGWQTHLYFMEAAAIITLISVGHWVEARVSAKAAGALKSLMTLAPQTARKLTRPAATRPAAPATPLQFNFRAAEAPARPVETEVTVAELNEADLVVLRPGDRVPVDGEVVEGESTVDEAMLTGESNPVEKRPGGPLYAGTANLNGRLVMRVTATGEATALAHIIAAVQRAQNSRANIQRLGDRVSNVFVPIVVTVALATALWWGLAFEHASRVMAWLTPFLWHAHPPTSPLAAAVIAAAAVLIVACPCAMGLATPAAIMAAANAAARRGILIRDGVALEKAGEVTAVLFDKTGTLTVGKPVLTDAWAVDSQSKADVTSWAAALAKPSSHPISQAIAAAAPAEAGVEDWREVRGAGVEGKIRLADGSRPAARLGSLRWLREAGVDLTPGEAFIKAGSQAGATMVGLVLGNQLRGLFAVQDALKPGAAAVVRRLQARGLHTYLVTGDNELTAAGIAKHAGIPGENVFAEVRPEQKADFVKQLQQRGEKVAFVGDGINDAPALEQADLGVAVSRASDVAREAADIILLKSDIEAVPESLGLARATLRTIKQNLFWAFFYNVAAVPLAALGFMSPVLCAATMGFSDLIVIGNALRLRRAKVQ
ncbi:MAG TPA: heavy metal translocating P-type ATPase [Verrucomicrobiae bacterium]|nr:heavy metal translocating P-type ATPase [Verrucomicrobiae bacterium]